MRPLFLGILGLPTLALAGCITSSGSTPTCEAPVASGAAVREDTRMSLTTLDQHCMAIGESYVNAMRNACDDEEGRRPSAPP